MEGDVVIWGCFAVSGPRKLVIMWHSTVTLNIKVNLTQWDFKQRKSTCWSGPDVLCVMKRADCSTHLKEYDWDEAVLWGRMVRNSSWIKLWSVATNLFEVTAAKAVFLFHQNIWLYNRQQYLKTVDYSCLYVTTLSTILFVSVFICILLHKTDKAGVRSNRQL